MRKTAFVVLLFLIICVSAHALASLPIDEENFPDDEFRGYVATTQVDKGKDGFLSNEEINGCTEIRVPVRAIYSLKGIEYFTSLTYLDFRGNFVTSVDLSHNTNLNQLYCPQNDYLVYLDVSNTKLKYLGNLNMKNDSITTVIARNCPALTDFKWSGGQLTTVDVSDSTSLKQVSFFNIPLDSFTADRCSSLTAIKADGTKLTTMSINDCTSLVKLSCGNNILKSLRMIGCSELEEIHCSYNNLSELDITGCTKLIQIVKDNPRTRISSETKNVDGFMVGDVCKFTLDACVTIKANGKILSASTEDNPEPSGTPDQEENTVIINDIKYEINTKKNEVIFCGSEKQYTSSLVVPDTVKIDKKTYKVTEIKAGACKDMKKLSQLTIGKNVKTIGKNAFSGCKKMKKITIIGTGLKKIGEGAFDKVPKKVVVICPKKKIEAYKKLLIAAGLNKKATIKEK